MDSHDITYTPVNFRGCPWISTDTNGYPWSSIDIDRNLQTSMEFHGLPYIHVEATIVVSMYLQDTRQALQTASTKMIP